MTNLPPEHPAGPFEPIEHYDEQARTELIDAIRQAPLLLKEAVAGLTELQLDRPYKNWTIRQITHHIADSHLHSIIRFKWALTEVHPMPTSPCPSMAARHLRSRARPVLAARA